MEILLFSNIFVLRLFSLAIMCRSNLMKTGCLHYKNYPCPGLFLLTHVYFFVHLLPSAFLPLRPRKQLKTKLEIWLRQWNFGRFWTYVEQPHGHILRLSYINVLHINQFYELKDQAIKFSQKNIENWWFWKMLFF